ncbi:MAG: GyrI-like domain-containing protein [Chitinophagaceae bacterium]
MKFLKPLAFFLIAVIAATAILSFFLPTSQQLERSVTIKAPTTAIYSQLAKLETFHQFSVWSQQDSTAIYTLTGTDGTVGASTSWTGDPTVSGDGKIEIVSLEPGKKVAQRISFSKPKKGTASSVFTLNEINGLTTVTWNFEMATPRPWNIFNLFYSMDKELGKDFDYSLATLKAAIEKTDASAAKTYEVMTMDFPATTYALIRQQVKWTDISSFFAQHLRILYAELQKNKLLPGTASGLIYDWDEKNQQANMAAAIPVPKGTVIKNPIVLVTDIPASKAVFVNYYGAYDDEPSAYTAIRKYLAGHHLKQQAPAIEQYIAGPGTENDPDKWVTKIIFLVE